MQLVVVQQDRVHHSSCSPAWDPDQQRIIAEAIKEAMDTSQLMKPRSRSRPRPTIDSPQDIPTPEAHLPLRKASAQRLQTRKGGVPRPLFAPSGIRPSPVQPLPYIDNVTASSEHAFAGRDVRRPFKPPLGGFQEQQYAAHNSYAAQRSPSLQEVESRPPSSPLLPNPPSPHLLNGKSLRNSKSLGEGLRGIRAHMPYGTSLVDSNKYDVSQPLPTPPGFHGDGPPA
ncbi:uncharacterized protein K489DRAFT_103764 [Dissoconium aciculare CBS 342.82]|uniref:Uncharacterized protein n=1 Tax=Dissoconium aciculare CBS 342.82 TaxID=1314786 RepID=A0A6J3MDR2_9PEZI|nr:uncharacterized protein K489DRAFT_103764 [Dissoconium aciculare CBS 342.82]KAF1826013.1 hypothetical protein K489DRAFT_103764 [Dissoconium aciculare CBS 342.82]